MLIEGPTTTEVEVIAAGTPAHEKGNDNPSTITSSPFRETTPDVLLSRFQSNYYISRRHSVQSAAGVVHPIEEAVGETSANTVSHSKKIQRRSSTTRGKLQTPKVIFNSFSRAGTAPKASNTANEDGHAGVRTAVKDLPYEEMMLRFQLRQLQRTASGTTIRSEGKRGSLISSHDPETGTARRSTGPHGAVQYETKQQQHHLQSQLHISAGDIGRISADEANLGSPGAHLDVRAGDHLASRPHENIDDAQGPDRPLSLGLARLQPWYQSLLTPISPFSEFSQARYVVIVAVAMAYVVFFPFGIAFPHQQQYTYGDASVGILLGLDVFLTLHTSYVRKDGTVVFSHQEIALHYLKNRFVPDVLLSVPLIVNLDDDTKKHIRGSWVHSLLDVLTAERLVHVARLVRMIWLVRLNELGNGNFWAWLLYSRYSHLLRIVAIITMLVCIAHYIACVWTVLLEEADEYDEPATPWRDQYSTSFYTALLLLQGEGVHTDTVGQNLFASLCVLVGSIVLAVVFGHVAILVANFNANSTTYQRKREEVFAMTAKLQLPAQLRERIHEYYEHLWHEYECLDGEIVQFSKELSHTLGLEVVLFKYMEVVMHVPFWKDCTPDFQKQLMLRLDVRVYLPNDLIMREGEVDDGFYMVNRGYCELTRPLNRFERVTNTMGNFANGFNTSRSNGSRRRYSVLSVGGLDEVHRQSAYELNPAQRLYYSNIGRRGANGYEVMLTRGQVFGDLALLMNYQRPANVTAITHVEMCIPSRTNFQDVLTRYPEDRKRVVVDMLTSHMQSYEANQTQCPLLELVRKLYSPEAIAELCAKAGTPTPLPLDTKLTARQAAERIYKAIDVGLQDSTLKFGIGSNVRDQLIDLRDRLRIKTQTKQTPARRDASPDTVDRISEYCESGESNHSSDSIPVERRSPIKQNRPPGTRSISWQVRLKQAEEREVAIFTALQDLKASFDLLRARHSGDNAPASIPASDASTCIVDIPEVAPPSRKRGLADIQDPAVEPAAVSRPKLLQRMGSLARLPSTSSLDKSLRRRGMQINFSTHTTQSHRPSQPPTTLHELQCCQLTSEGSSQVNSTSIFRPLERGGLSNEIRDSITMARFGHRGVLRRTHSQISQSAATSPQAHTSMIESLSSTPGHLLRRPSPSMAGPRESVTPYADALFRPRMIEKPTPSTKVESSNGIDHRGS